jgi:cell shape-determining protein MreC
VGVRVGDEVSLARGNGAGNALRSGEGMSRENRVISGDTVLTAGSASSWFPPGIPVGRVDAVDRSTGGLIVTVTPAADVANVDFVSVLLFEAPGR